MTDTARAWRASRPGRPRSLNAERSAHWREHRRATAAERGEWAWLWHAERAGGPRPTAARVEVTATVYTSGVLPDPGNAYPSVKAAIDGAVDAGLIAGDTGEYLARVILEAPVRCKRGAEALTVTIRECP